MNTKNVTMNGNDKIAFISNMATMLSAGIPILEAINSLLEDAKGGQRKLLLTLAEDLNQGQHVYYTFNKFPKIFDKVTVNIIKASEEAGTLDTALVDLKTTIKKDMEFNDKIRGALIYPVFILALFMVVLVVILIVVVPKISTVFTQLNVPLPLPTKVMIFMSNALLHNTLPVVSGTLALFGGIIYLYKTNRRFFIDVLISLPVVSGLAKDIDLTRFTRSMFLLLSAGIPITNALELTQEVVANHDIYNAIKYTKNFVYGGKKFSEGLKNNKRVIPPIMIRIIEAGERSGSIDKSMLDVSDYLDYQVSNKLKTVTALIEPFLLVFVGVLVGGMMVAIIAPIYSMIGQVGPQ